MKDHLHARPVFWIFGGFVAAGGVLYLLRRFVLKTGNIVIGTVKKQAFVDSLVAATPSGRATQYADDVLKVAEEEDFNPFIIVALMERESHSGTALSPPTPSGTGDSGHGRGLMQLDDRTKGGSLHGTILADGRWTIPYWNIKAAVVDHLKPDMSFFLRKGLTGDALTRATLAAYNRGAGNIWNDLQAGRDVDSGTTGHNYSADVLSKFATLSQAFAQRVGVGQ